MLELEIVPRLDALRAKKQTFLKFQNLKSEREDIANYLILFDYFNTLVSYINLTPVKSREI
jgi:chromosome segregation ATPase